MCRKHILYVRTDNVGISVYALRFWRNSSHPIPNLIKMSLADANMCKCLHPKRIKYPIFQFLNLLRVEQCFRSDERLQVVGRKSSRKRWNYKSKDFNILLIRISPDLVISFGFAHSTLNKRLREAIMHNLGTKSGTLTWIWRFIDQPRMLEKDKRNRNFEFLWFEWK